MTSLVYIDGQIGEGFFGEGLTVSMIQQQVDPAADEVEVHINSIGGDVREGFAIHDYLKSLDKKVTTVVIGKCYSIATIALLAGDERLMQPNAEIMIHNPWGFVEGDADEIRKYGDYVQEQEDRILDFYADQTGQSQSDLRKWMDDQTFMGFEDAKKNGFVTGEVKEMKAVAILNNDNMKEFSEEQKKELESWFTKLENKVSALFKSKVKNLQMETSETKFFVQTDNEEIVGKEVFASNENGEISDEPLKDGDYVLNDGRTVKVKDAKVSEVVDKTNELEAVQAELAQAKQALEDLKAEREKEKEEVQNKDSQLQEVQNSLKELRGMVFGSEPPKPQPPKKEEEDDDSMAGLVSWANKINNN